MHTRTLKVCSGAILVLFCVVAQLYPWAQAAAATEKAGNTDVWQVPVSQNLMPHFEEANGRKVLYVDGRPFTALAVESNTWVVTPIVWPSPTIAWSPSLMAKSPFAGVIPLITTNRSCYLYRSTSSCVASCCTSFRRASCAA
jgi:hypothetical protein